MDGGGSYSTTALGSCSNTWQEAPALHGLPHRCSRAAALCLKAELSGSCLRHPVLDVACCGRGLQQAACTCQIHMYKLIMLRGCR